MERENWRSDPDWIATMGRLGFEVQWYTCDCGAHWRGDHCGPECVHAHRQYSDWDLCNWPPEMLKYWDIWNWRARTPPVDYPEPPRDPRYELRIAHWVDRVSGKRDPNRVGLYMRAPVLEPVVFQPGEIAEVGFWLTPDEIEGMILEFRNRKIPQKW